jgi:ribosomal-protein-alanine N-acetyltransferase
MKQLRRIQVAPATDAYGKAQRGTLRYVALSEAEFRALERERRALVIVEGDAVLIGWPASGAIDLQYAFPGHEAFARQFPAMLQRLLPAIHADEAPLGLRLRLTERSARPYIEPVLSAHAFEQTREWWRMTLAELPEAGPPADHLAPGFLLRPARPEDAEAIAEMDAASFPPPWLTPDTARALVARARLFRIVKDAGSGRAAGFLRLRTDAPGVGYVSDLAVHPDYWRRGLGEAMLRWAMGWFRSQGLKSAALQVNTDNSPAIALYRKLGFTAGEIGLDYRRPIDEEEVRQVLEKRRTEHITMRTRH